MKMNTLIRTNIVVCIIIVIGFVTTSVIGYQSNIGRFEKDIQDVSTLASDGIYHQIDSIFAQPVSVSLTMANDNLLKGFLTEEEEKLDDVSYINELRDYLNAYREKYQYDSVFLVSSSTNRYYHFNGLDRVLVKGDAENVWYYEFLDKDEEYSLNVDNDEASSNVITIFVNCKIKNKDGSTMGVVGVGLKTDSLQTLLQQYDEEFGVNACLVDDNGIIQISSLETGYEHVNLFDDAAYASQKEVILNSQQEKRAFWLKHEDKDDSYVVTTYVPNLKWHLVVAYDSTVLNQQFHHQLTRGIVIIILIIFLVLFIITTVIRKYNSQIIELTVGPELEYQKLLHKATEGIYESILEIDITNNKISGASTKQYLKSIGVDGDLPYEEALKAIAHKQLKEEYIQEYLEIFSRSNVLEAFDNGIKNLTYDFLMHRTDDEYHWMRITAQIFYWASDQSVRMITYRENIDEEKRREISLIEETRRDSLTGLYNKRTTEELAESVLKARGAGEIRHALLVLDIDNFKYINDNLGHAFGDNAIIEFAAELKAQFRDSDIIGRIGGDEFAVLLKDFKDLEAIKKKLETFCASMGHQYLGENKSHTITASVGVAFFPEHGGTFAELFQKADQALYFSKSHGKGSYSIFGAEYASLTAYQVNQRELAALANLATDGITKIAWVEGRFKVLYYNEKRAALTGTPQKVMSDPGFDVLSQFHPDDLQQALEVFKAALPTREPFTTVYRLRHEAGHYIKVRIRGLFVSELFESKYPVFYAVYTDLTSRE